MQLKYNNIESRFCAHISGQHVRKEGFMDGQYETSLLKFV
jgi:hypothetical protein